MASFLNLLVLLPFLMDLTSTNALRYEMYEEMASRTRIGNIPQDSKLGNVVSNLTDLRYSLLTQGNPHSLLFNVEEASGDLSNSRLLDRESICSFLDKCDLHFEVIVQSYLGSFFRKISVIVTLLDINDNAPEFAQTDFSLDVSEGVVVGSSFPILAAVDKDTDVNNSVRVYELLDHSDIFALSTQEVFGGNLEVSLQVLKALDREVVPVYKLTVLAKDMGNPPKSGSLLLTVNVKDVNDNAPEFEYPSYSINVSETVALNGLIVRLSASDADVGVNANLTYHFTARQPETLLKPFTLNSTNGELRLASSLESSAGNSYRILAEAKDNGNPSLTTQVRVDIHVLDTHNNPPEVHVNTFSSSGAAEVSESSTVGRAVAHIGVHDPDSGANGKVNCSISHDYITLSQLDVNEYKGILSKPLDRETVSQHSVIVVCYDSGTPRLTTSVSFEVKVLDENDNAPVFSQTVYKASITENNFVPQYITSVSAVDYDAGSNAEIVYAVVGDNRRDFNIMANGTLFAAAQFDREVSPVVYATVTATDNGLTKLTSTATVEIALGDQNDKRPEFKHSVFHFNVNENMPPGTQVGKVEAFDKDANENAVIYISMDQSVRDGHPFASTSEGMILTTQQLDRETKNRYVFNVVATDMGKHPLSSTVQVVVHVKDTNDQSPVILYPNAENNTFSIPNSYAARTGFSAILAYDLDDGVNSKIDYFLKKGNFSDKFEVHSATGDIFTAKSFHEHELGIYHLVLGARDQGTPSLTSFADLYVEVYHANVTLTKTSAILSRQNVVTVTVLLCITIILGLFVLLTIYLIRRRDKQKRIYNAKSEENRVISMMKQSDSDSNIDVGITNSSSNIQLSPTDSVASSAKKEVSFSLDDDNNMCFDSDMELCPAAKSSTHVVDQVSKELQEEGRVDGSSVMSDAVSASDSGRGGSDVDVSSQTISHDTDMFYTQGTNQPSVGSSNRHFPLPSEHQIPPYSAQNQQILPPLPPLVPKTDYPQRQSSAHPPAYNAQHNRQWRNRNTYSGGRPHTINLQNSLNHSNVPAVTKDDTSIYMEMKAPLRNDVSSARCSVLDESSIDALWDNDTTTTSGSYTIDADELCQEIDKLFFKESEDIFV